VLLGPVTHRDYDNNNVVVVDGGDDDDDDDYYYYYYAGDLDPMVKKLMLKCYCCTAHWA